MFHIIIRNPLDYTLTYEGKSKTLKGLAETIKKEYPHNTFFTFQKLKYIHYNKSKVDFVEINNLKPHKKNKLKL